MFKIGRLNNIDNEKIEINKISQEINRFINGEKFIDKFDGLEFNIYNSKYSFSFCMNCPLEKLLELSINQSIDFKDYIFDGEIWFNVKEEISYDIELYNIDIKINRYLKNRFLILIKFYAGDEYSGVIELSFNLDDYI